MYLHTVFKYGFLGFSRICLGGILGLPSLGCSGVCLRFYWVVLGNYLLVLFASKGFLFFVFI